MEEEAIVPGSLVRYPRTGTSGRVDSIRIIDGREFAFIESEGLCYRTDQLILVDSVKDKRERGEEEGIDRFRNQKELSSEELRDAFDDVTGVGAG